MNICTDTAEWLKLLFQGTVTLAALVAIWRWRKNEKWKLNFLLADSTLVAFHRMEAIIEEIRNPFSFGGEVAPRKKKENEKPEEAKALDIAHTTFERLQRHRDFISDFRAKRFEVLTRFGKEADSLFGEMMTALYEVTSGARRYVEESIALKTHEEEYRVLAHDPELGPPHLKQRNSSFERLQEAKRLIWSIGSEDEHAKKVDIILNKVKEMMAPHLKE